MTNITLRCDRVGDWQVAFAIDQPDRAAVHPSPGSAVGVDRGFAVAVATSVGDLLDPGRTLTAGEGERLRRLERITARQMPGSVRHHKTRTAIAKLRRRQARRRTEFAHQTSHALATAFQTVVIEDLWITSMISSARGTVEAPGSRVAQKARLNRSISDKGWGQLDRMVAYKTDRAGGPSSR